MSPRRQAKERELEARAERLRAGLQQQFDRHRGWVAMAKTVDRRTVVVGLYVRNRFVWSLTLHPHALKRTDADLVADLYAQTRSVAA